MEKMTAEEMPLFIDFLQKNVDIKTKELELFKIFPAKFMELNLTNLFIPAQDTIIAMQGAVSKLQKQIELLKNPDVLKMSPEEFREYIN